MIHVNAVEAFWILTNAVTFAITLWALLDARRDLIAVRGLNGHVRGIVARGNVRREWIRLVVQTLLLGIVAPGLFSDREIVLTPVLVMLITVPVLLLISTVYDQRDRTRIAHRLAVDFTDEPTALQRLEAQGDRLEHAIEEGTRVSQEASDHASAAYHEANTVNQKLAAQGREILDKRTEP